MKTYRKYTHLFLPLIAFNIAYLMLFIQDNIQDWPLLDGTENFGFGLECYLLLFMLFIPPIIISYIYLIYCKNNISRFNIITPLLVAGYVLLLVSIDPMRLLFIVLLSGLFYCVPLILLYILLFIRYDKKKWMQLVSLVMSMVFFVFACVTSTTDTQGTDTTYYTCVYETYWIAIYILCYLLCQFKKCNLLWVISTILMLSASAILEFATPLNFILVTQFIIAFIIFSAEIVARHYTKVDKAQE